MNEKGTLLVPVDLNESALSSFWARLDNLLEESPDEIAIDCSSLDHVSSNHVCILWQAYDRCEQAGIPMRLASISYGLERVLKVLDLYGLLVTGQKPRHESDHTVSLHPQTMQLELKATVDEIDDALGKFRHFLTRLNLTGIYAFDLETLLYEVATNIRLHGRLNENDSIAFTATTSREKVTLRFVDPGLPFDPANSISPFDPQEAIRKKQKHGLGLILIQRMVDSMFYQRVNNRLNVLTLEKNWLKEGGSL